jgi:hypothetical protein
MMRTANTVIVAVRRGADGFLLDTLTTAVCCVCAQDDAGVFRDVIWGAESFDPDRRTEPRPRAARTPVSKNETERLLRLSAGHPLPP